MNIIRTPFPWLIIAVVAAALIFADRWPHVAVLLTAATALVCGMGIQRALQQEARK